MTDVELLEKTLCELYGQGWRPVSAFTGAARVILNILTANGRAKIVRREPTLEMKDAAGRAFAAHGGAWGALCAAYDAAPEFSDQDEAVPVKTPERSS
jgi:drug/metabolite transporter superfamily protein YnfA